MAALKRLALALPILLFSPILVLLAVVAFIVTDSLWRLFGRERRFADSQPDTRAASIVIPNWNGRDLLARYLPSVIEAVRGNPANEVIVVDNGSEDGSAAFVRERFPSVRLIALERNLGFGGGSNAGFRAAKNDIVLLLNSDMRVAPNFLQPLLDGFTGPQVFAVSCQIFFSDPAKKREETGLTQFWWERGRLRVRHRIDDSVGELFPCAYGGGGSCAFDRRKFLELGGFDELLRPFYLEDTDLGYMAWKRGWQVFYEPRSIVYHEHRGTIGKRFSQAYIDSVLQKNFVLFAWKNIHEPWRLLSQIAHVWGDAILSTFAGESPERGTALGLWRAFLQLPQALISRWRTWSLAAVNDTEAFLRPLGGYFRDRFEAPPTLPERLSVLFVSPYPICPPVHGGAVFMYNTVRKLAELCDVHLLVLVDFERQCEAHAELSRLVRSAEFIVRARGLKPALGSTTPHAVAEFRSSDVEWAMQRIMYLKRVDAVQLEYLSMGQYRGEYSRLASVLFDHDVYFQSVGRQIAGMSGMRKAKAQLEYLRALRYELALLESVDAVQVPSPANRDYLLEFAPGLAGKIDARSRAGIDPAEYRFERCDREPDTMLFLGSFRHAPNHEAIAWFARDVLPKVREARPAARLVLVGSGPPPRLSFGEQADAIEFRGFVEDVREPLGRYAVFVCPILSGSGMRVKLLEAFATGIPVVSTRLGAEGLAENGGEICELADDPGDFAASIVALLSHGERARRLAEAARQAVVAKHDSRRLTVELESSYRELLARKRNHSLAVVAQKTPSEPRPRGSG
jgi:GT2 family glycosyltransferase/glycosyltransferase involved in cell wall biosynthesis